MKKIIIAVLLIVPLIFLAFYIKNKPHTNNSINVERTSLKQNITNDFDYNQIFTPTITPTPTPNTNDTSYIISPTAQIYEEEISSFTTDILTDDDKRENNIDITCSKINNYIIKPGETFSFTETVGQSTRDKGYQEADIFDANGNKVKGLGGGNCQVSSTLYNAVLEAKGDFEIVERHEHSEKVYYVPDGKDATISYGSLDFKFKNNNNFDVKIYATTDTETVTVKLFKIS